MNLCHRDRRAKSLGRCAESVNWLTRAQSRRFQAAVAKVVSPPCRSRPNRRFRKRPLSADRRWQASKQRIPSSPRLALEIRLRFLESTGLFHYVVPMPARFVVFRCRRKMLGRHDLSIRLATKTQLQVSLCSIEHCWCCSNATEDAIL